MVCIFVAGDELGNIKTVRCHEQPTASGSRAEVKTIFDGTASGKEKSIQGLAISSGSTGGRSIITTHADGAVNASSICEEGSLKREHGWNETRLKPGQRFVGLAAHEKVTYTCTSNGALRRTWVDDAKQELQHATASLPMRLCDWRLSGDEKSFIYGGEEVEVSLWDTERAFASQPPNTEPSAQTSKKRKRGGDLLPGETWRAKNVPNDFLSLRQPVHNTSLTYLSSPNEILTGTMFGNVRRYDARAARRPVADWKGVSKVGGVKLVHKGHNENEVFVADQGSNLFAMDLRNGRILYGYKGLSGAITSIASAPSLLGSVSLDRYFRLHSIYPPPADAKQRQEQRGEVVDKVYMNSIPTVLTVSREDDGEDDEDENDDDIWETMQNIDESTKEASRSNRKKKAKE
ncbi:hypothetical protein GLOTRDRAFT_114648 [Gloeophyllum trabeum ATCC 11539]|uniref:Ribosome biogenesis protein NSA1 n=1 Tax=Gloeophyllum trabeum (strain ATCC 11539 / FP-39264 / Madison 617) TaxID=670483 RepID=S7RTZ1_GLOTA|nr:uncharacterized protein GLOTRDRAFT_114648 [Gloeophyllum trabeum ATCC 11539]EPQ58170.1 hypothetical protein GLOTRDRAFT_114648 [Gloeophyllum trabeum ATCC 11539]